MQSCSCFHLEVEGRDQDREGRGVCDILWRHYQANGTAGGVGQTKLEVHSDV